MLLLCCAPFLKRFPFGCRALFRCPHSSVMFAVKVNAVPDKSWTPLFLHFRLQRERIEYFTVSWVCNLHLLLTNGALAGVRCLAFISPSWSILNSGLESSGVLTLHLCRLLSIRTCSSRAIAVSFFFMSHMHHTLESNASVETRAHLQLFNSIFNLRACVHCLHSFNSKISFSGLFLRELLLPLETGVFVTSIVKHSWKGALRCCSSFCTW